MNTACCNFAKLTSAQRTVITSCLSMPAPLLLGWLALRYIVYRIHTVIMMMLMMIARRKVGDERTNERRRRRRSRAEQTDQPRLTTLSCCIEFLYLFAFFATPFSISYSAAPPPHRTPPYYLYADFIGDRYSVTRKDCNKEEGKIPSCHIK